MHVYNNTVEIETPTNLGTLKVKLSTQNFEMLCAVLTHYKRVYKTK